MKLVLLLLCNVVLSFVLGSAGFREASSSVSGAKRELLGESWIRWTVRRPDVEWYSGGLMGVGAEVLLDRARMVAHVTLKGPVFPGMVSGFARFSDPETSDVLGGGVSIGEPLRSVLKRRFVSISEARYDALADEVVVRVKLPMALGKHTLRLQRL